MSEEKTLRLLADDGDRPASECAILDSAANEIAKLKKDFKKAIGVCLDEAVVMAKRVDALEQEVAAYEKPMAWMALMAIDINKAIGRHKE